MDPERWRQVSEVFHEVVDLDERSRSEVLDAKLGSDADAREIVHRLLRDDLKSARIRFMDRPPLPVENWLDSSVGQASVTGMDTWPILPSLPDPEHVGPYRILEKLGEGAMGIVYVGEQEKPLHRRVAIKVIKLGMDTKEVIARFESERQALALMDHPSIATVFDAGSTETGRPYFVMEHVSGTPIGDYCDRHRLCIRDRLKLFIPVCRAIHHAHQKGIIHRDIKVSNVLVGMYDGHPVPKVIDFGVAKAIHRHLTDHTLYTEQGRLIGTPAYMSPEQAEMTALGIDTTTDVYSLGVLLYVLLTGTVPFSTDELIAEGYEAVGRRIRELEPTRPSERVATLEGDTAAQVAIWRDVDPASLQRQLRGELDWVTMRAMEKDRTRRYASASEFAADIERYLENEPVVAGPPSKLYRFHKAVLRHRHFVTYSSLAIVLLIAFGTTMAVMFRQQRQERIRAERVIAAYLDEFLATADPTRRTDQGSSVDGGPEVGSGRASDGPLGADRIDVLVEDLISGSQLSDLHDIERDSRERLRVVDEIVERFWKDGTIPTDGRVALATKTIAIKQAVWGQGHAEVASSLHSFAGLLFNENRLEEARALFQRAAEIRKAQLGTASEEYLKSRNNVAYLDQRLGRFEEARTGFEEVLKERRQRLGARHSDVAKMLRRLGSLCDDMGEYDASIEYLTEALDIFVANEDSPGEASVRRLLGNLYFSIGDYFQAQREWLHSIPIEEQVSGPNSAVVCGVLTNLAAVRSQLGEHDDAERLYRDALSRLELFYGTDEHPTVALAMDGLGGLLRDRGRFKEARVLLERALTVREKTLGPDHLEVARSLASLGVLLRNVGDFGPAAGMLERALSIRKETLGSEHLDVARTLASLAILRELSGQHGQADACYTEAVDIWHAAAHQDHPGLAILLRDWGLAARHAGELARAESLLVESVRVLNAMDQNEDARSRVAAHRALSWWHLGSVRLDSNRPVEAWAAIECGLASSEWRTASPIQDALVPRGSSLDAEAEIFESSAPAQQLLERVQGTLDPMSAFLGWFEFDDPFDQSGAWGYIIRSSGPVTWVDLPHGVATEDRALVTLTAHGGDAPRVSAGVWPRGTAESWRQRVVPMLQFLDGITDLIILPSTAAGTLPFEVMREVGGVDLTGRFSLHYSPSATAHARLVTLLAAS